MQNPEAAAAAGAGIGRDRAHWEREAANWVKWTRKPGHDPYWHYSPAFFQELVPPPGQATLEIGCGEGRVVRDLTARGHRTTGVDASSNLIAAADGLRQWSRRTVNNACQRNSRPVHG